MTARRSLLTAGATETAPQDPSTFEGLGRSRAVTAPTETAPPLEVFTAGGRLPGRGEAGRPGLALGALPAVGSGPDVNVEVARTR